MFIYSLYVAEDINTLLMYPLNAQLSLSMFSLKRPVQLCKGSKSRIFADFLYFAVLLH